MEKNEPKLTNKEILRRTLLSTAAGAGVGTALGFGTVYGNKTIRNMSNTLNPGNRLAGDMLKGVDKKYIPYIVGGGVGLFHGGQTLTRNLIEKHRQNKG